MNSVSATTAPRFSAHQALKSAGITWFIVATIGQWIFVYYILAYYGGKTLSGAYGEINDRGLITGYVDGHVFGNVMFFTHVFLAAVMTVGGALQLTPQIRNRVPVLHRWVGRLFVVTALVLAIGGYVMTWAMGVRLTDIGAMGVSLNAHLIVFFALLTIFYAMKGKIDTHRRWAMRLYMVCHGVWFFRLGLMGWYMLNQGPMGNTSNLDGPADLALSFGSYLVPLAVLELYQRATDLSSAPFKWIMTAVVFLGALATGFGVFAAYAMLWAPHL
ncbi:DUF2306 domain-containing protein [Maricaulis sp. D1M11]|uniref:DUF2306 domain-containing protein n=1 Tax=Maricaulis sp. D1M11 TaxID=3076117 RepID=UPI0039B607DC